MKTRGTRGGILLSLDGKDTPETLEAAFSDGSELLAGRVIVEVAERVSWDAVESLVERIRRAGGTLVELRPPSGALQPRGETVIVSRTIRSGARIESSGSIVVLGDVNAGAELVANDDIIVIGMLRGLAHAGAGGNEKALIWAQQILSPQLRIGTALAQSGDDGGEPRGPEVAQLVNGQIVLQPWT